MNKIKSAIRTNDWLEVTWSEEIKVTQEVEVEKEIDGETVKVLEEQETVTEKVIHCESFSGHPGHIAMLEARAKEFETSLEEYKSEIEAVMEAFVMPSDEEIQAEIQANLIQEAQNYLNSTDWYIVRFVDEGIEVPEDIKIKRAEAREFIRANTEGGK